MPLAGPGKVDNPAEEIITPLNPTWDEAIASLNRRPHPLLALSSDDDDAPGAIQDPAGAGPGSEMTIRPRWEYWTAREKAKGHPGYTRRAEVMKEDCELLMRVEEGENGDLMEDEDYELAETTAELIVPPATTRPTNSSPPPPTPDEPVIPTSPVAPSPSLAGPLAHDFAFNPPTPLRHSPPAPTPFLAAPPASSPLHPILPPTRSLASASAVPLSRLPVPPRPPLSRAPDSLDDPAPLPLRRSTGATKTYGKKRAQSEHLLVADSSEDELDTAASLRATLQQLGRKPSATNAPDGGASAGGGKAGLKRSKTTPGAPADAPPAKKGRTKPRKSTDQFLEAIKTVNAFKKHRQEHPTISSTIDKLSEMEVARVARPVLEGVRVALVSHYSVVTSRQANLLDIAHRNQMGILLRNGATLVKPEDFRSAAYRAGEGPLTTHVIPLEVENFEKYNPTFREVLALLGRRKDKLTVAELGDEVKVVSFKWVSESVDAKHRLKEDRHIWPGDPRSPLGSPSKRARKAAAPPSRQASRAQVESDEGSTDEDDHEHTDGTDNEHPPVAGLDTDTATDPIIEGDTTLLTCPPAVAILRGGNPSSFDSPVPSPRRRRIQPMVIEGLEKEIGMVQTFGTEFVDSMFAEGDATDAGNLSDTYIFSALDDDNETDEEDSDSDGGKAARIKKAPAYIHGPEGKFTCDRPNTAKVGDKYSPNEPTAQVFDSMSELVRQDKMRQRAYRLAAGALRNRADLVDTYEKAKAIRGIGHKLALKVVEIQKTGTLRRLANTTQKERVTAQFREIYGVGSVIANDLFDLGCRSMDDVRALTDARYKLTPAQRLGLQYYDDLSTKMPRAEVTQFHDLAREAAAEIDPKLLVFAMGSYIRGAEECGDVDFIVTRDTSDGRDHSGMIKRLWQKLMEKGMIRHSLADPSDWESLSVKYNGLCAVPDQEGAKMRRIDILGVPWDELPAARIYFTGNDFFNRSMRLKAAHLGYRLNQRGLYQDVMRGPGKVKITEGVRVPGVKTEEDIFRVLQVPWRQPWERLP